MADRNAAKRRRQAQNKAAREQLAARRAAAQRVDDDGRRPARTASGVARATGRGGSRSSRTSAAATSRNGSAGRSSAGTSTRAARPVRPVRPGPPWLARFGYDEPGGRFVIFGAAFTVISSIVLLFLPVVPRGGLGKVAAEAAKVGANASTASRADIVADAKVHTQTIVKAASGLAALYLLGPIVIALITVIVARPGNRRRTWAFGAVAMFLWIMVSQGLGIYYIVSFGAIAWGAYTAYRAHREELLAAGEGGAGSGRTVPARGREAGASAGTSERRPGLLESLFKPQPRPQRAPARGRQVEEVPEEDDESDAPDGSARTTQRRPGLLESLFKPQPRPQRAPARGRQVEEVAGEEDEYDEADSYEEDEYDEADSYAEDEYDADDEYEYDNEDQLADYDDEDDIVDVNHEDDYDDEPSVYDDEADEEGSESYASASTRQRRRLWRR